MCCHELRRQRGRTDVLAHGDRPTAYPVAVLPQLIFWSSVGSLAWVYFGYPLVVGAAAKLAPEDPEARVAASVARFDKSRPAAAFSRLGPLTRRFPRAPTVRFHLGLLLLWLARAQPGAVEEGKRQLRLARNIAPRSPLAREAKRLLAGLESGKPS